MKNKYFTPHIILSQKYWMNFLEKNDIVIDATLGNGKDSLFLSRLLNLDKKRLFCIDIQKIAIEKSKRLLKANLDRKSFENISFINNSHEKLDMIVDVKANLIVYNLGYLPGGDKSITTMANTTILSLNNAFNILNKKAAISIISYPRHEEGKKEDLLLGSFLKSLDPKEFSVLKHFWINKYLAPIFYWIEKRH
jgi:Putative rRNA methylase